MSSTAAAMPATRDQTRSHSVGAPQPDAGGLSHRQILTILAGLMAGMFLAALDQTIVASAIRTIGDDLHGLTVQAWVTTAYLITSTITTPLYGKLSDIYGRRPFFLIAIVLFIIGSFASAFATSMYMLAAFRAFQGLGAGGLFSLALTILGDIVPPRQRAKYQGYFLAVFGTSSVLGPVIGGFFAGQHSILGFTGWRWVFLVNVPIGLVALAIVYRVLHIPHTARAHKIDWPGAVALVVCLVPLLTVAEQGRTWGWGSGKSIACYVLAVLGLVAFLLAERRIGEDALISLRFFRNRTFVLVVTINVLVGAAMFGGIALLPLYLQIVKGASPTKSGLLLIPLTLGIMIGSIISGQLIARTGRYKIFPIIGTAVLAATMGAMYSIGADTSLAWTDTLMLFFGLGLGGVMQPTVLAIQNAMPPKDIGVSTSSATFFRQIGATLGTAVFLSVLYSTVTGNLTNAFRGAAATPAFQQALGTARAKPTGGNVTLLKVLSGQGTGGALNDTSFLRTADHTLAHPFYVGFSRSMDTVFVIGSALLVVAFAMVWFLREVPLRTQSGLEAAASEAAEAASGAATAQPGLTNVGLGDSEDRTDSADSADSTVVGDRSQRVDSSSTGVSAPAAFEPAVAAPPAAVPAADTRGATVPAAVTQEAAVPAGVALNGSARLNGTAVPAVSTRSDSSGSTVTGRVLTADGAGLGSATLTLTDLAGRQLDVARSAADGTYRLTAPAGGTFLLVCLADGFQPLASTVTVSGADVSRDQLLARASRVTGRVTGFGGEPLAGASVAVTDARGQVVAAVRTDGDGAFVLLDLYAGDYTLAVSAAGHQPAARSVTVTAGAPTVCDVALGGVGTITGTIRAATSSAGVAEATVTLIDDTGNVVSTVITDDAGHYRVRDLRSGDYTITATGYAPAVAGVRVPNGDLDGVDLALRNAAAQAADEHVEGRHAAHRATGAGGSEPGARPAGPRPAPIGAGG